MRDRKLVGVRADDRAINAWNNADDLDIEVMAMPKGNGTWIFAGLVCGETRITGTIFGGKQLARKCVVKVRDGLTSRVMRKFVNKKEEAI